MARNEEYGYGLPPPAYAEGHPQYERFLIQPVTGPQKGGRPAELAVAAAAGLCAGVATRATHVVLVVNPQALATAGPTPASWMPYRPGGPIGGPTARSSVRRGSTPAMRWSGRSS